MSRLKVVGAGSWGTALAMVLAPRFDRVELWGRDRALVEAMGRQRENARYLPGFPLPANVHPTTELAGDADFVLNVVPSQYTRQVFGGLAKGAVLQDALEHHRFFEMLEQRHWWRASLYNLWI